MIKAIETRFAGCRFRSRLEARWAVFFDHCDIPWQYEVEGWRLDTLLGRIQYLPDFRLFNGQIAEVKGQLDMAGCNRLCTIAVAACQCSGGTDMVVLGDVPRPGSARWPIQLHAHDDRLFLVPWALEHGCPLGRPHMRVHSDRLLAGALTEGILAGHPEWARNGLQAARAARFEFGESG